MIRFGLLLNLYILSCYAIEIIQKPIIFNDNRIELTKAYIQSHYNLTVNDITIKPRFIVIHHTAFNTLNDSFENFNPVTINSKRPFVAKSGLLNPAAHYLIDKEGTIYQLMPDNFMARHVIGLNYSSIGIENVGGANHEDNLTDKQLQANVELIKHLKGKYQNLNYVLGHYEYQNFENHELWLEVNDNYRTIKSDPSPRFMKRLKEELTKSKLQFKMHTPTK